MLAKRTSKNQITLPKVVASRFEGVVYFDISTDGQAIVLRPLEVSRVDAVHDRLASLGINELDVKEAISWVRENS
jgi:hypothetical protein